MPRLDPQEVALLNDLRSAQGRAPLSPAEIAAMEAEPEPYRRSAEGQPASPEERQAIEYVRSLQPREGAEGRPAAGGIRPPDVGRIVGGTLDRTRPTLGAVAQDAPEDMSEDAALAYLRGAAGPTPVRAQDPAPSAGSWGEPAPFQVDAAALAAAGYPAPVTVRESATLAEMAAEYIADGDPPMTSAKATQLVLTWRRRAA